MYKVNDFFCGAGGFGLGFKNVGFEIAGSWDFDKYAVQSYKHNVDDKVQQMDITEMNANDIPFADVWTFGFPCQDVSIAGKQKGMIKGKTRSGLFYEIMRLLEESDRNNKPSLIIAENVKAIRKYLPIIEEEYNKVGYRMYTTLYNSKYWNVPQNRERFFIVGVREDINKDFEFVEQQTEYVPSLSTVLENNVDDKYYIADDKAEKIIEQAKERLDGFKNVHACLTPDRVNKRQNGRRAKDNEQEMFTLTAQDRHGILTYNPPHGWNQGNFYEHYTGTVTSRDYKGPRLLIENNLRVRKLIPREYARLQGFPDSYEQVVSDTQFYKQMGNAVTVNVAEAIATAAEVFLDNL